MRKKEMKSKSNVELYTRSSCMRGTDQKCGHRKERKRQGQKRLSPKGKKEGLIFHRGNRGCHPLANSLVFAEHGCTSHVGINDL